MPTDDSPAASLQALGDLLRLAQAAALVQIPGGTVSLGVVVTHEESGTGRVTATFELESFLKDLGAVVGSPSPSVDRDASVVEAVLGFRDWVSCDCSECKSGISHAVDTSASMEKLAEKILEVMHHSPSIDEAATPGVVIHYTNHRGETADRRIVPIKIVYKGTEWHPEPQWLLQAYDHDRQAERLFALADISAWRKP